MPPVPTNDAEESVVSYLQAHMHFLTQRPVPEGWCYRGPYDLLQQHGTFYDGSVLLPDEWAGVIHATPKYCYDNAYWLAVASRGKLRYVEGLATRFITCDHAWCIDADGKVVDPTWAALDGDVKPSAYYGVVIPLPVVRAARRRPDCASALFGWGFRSDTIFKQPYAPDMRLPVTKRKKRAKASI